MFGKLMKYDFRSCWRKFCPVWGGLIALMIINALCYKFNSGKVDVPFVAEGLPILVLFGFAVGAGVIALLYIYDEFAKGLLGERGYLAMTLPVRTEALIGSKALTALIMEAISAIVLAVGSFLILIIMRTGNFRETLRALKQFFTESDGTGLLILFGLECILLAIVISNVFNFQIYTSSAVAHLFSKSKNLVWIVAFVVLNVICIKIVSNLIGPAVTSAYQAMSPNFVDWKSEIRASMVSIGFFILGGLVYSGAMFFGTNYILKNKLNLE